MATPIHQRYCVLTGGSAGLGLATALELARRGMHVTGVCRNLAGAKQLLKHAVEEGVGDRVVAEIADLSRISQVRSLALRLRRRMHRLDILINNAGVVMPEPTLTCEGVETTFAVNYLSHFLLSHELLDLLCSGPARVINIVDDRHREPILPLHACQSPEGYDWARAYNRAMFAKTAFSLELARRLTGDGVTVHALHPGTVKTELFRRLGPLERGKMQLTGIPPRLAAAHVVAMAVNERFAGVTGEYYRRGSPAEPAALATRREAVQHLWELSERLCAPPERSAAQPLQTAAYG